MALKASGNVQILIHWSVQAFNPHVSRRLHAWLPGAQGASGSSREYKEPKSEIMEIKGVKGGYFKLGA
jgi:hypothetical protein